MATTSKSPRAVLVAAHAVAAAAIPAYAHRYSPKVYTQHQVFACLVLKAFLKADYRGVAALLADCPDLRDAIGMRRAPHFTTLQKAAARLLAAEATTPLLDATVARAMGRRRRVGTAAADATGFESRHVSPYFLRRSGREGKRTRRYTRFPKLDIVCDCSNHLILAASAGQGPRPDVAGFAKLARGAARRVRITRLVADAGYDSEPNHALARDELGIHTTIPPTRGRPSKGPPTGKYRRLMRRRFNRRAYRRRWQVETVFSSMKRRLGSSARGRSYGSRCRDLWLMVLTHNIMLLWRALRGFLQSSVNLVSASRIAGYRLGDGRSRSRFLRTRDDRDTDRRPIPIPGLSRRIACPNRAVRGTIGVICGPGHGSPGRRAGPDAHPADRPRGPSRVSAEKPRLLVIERDGSAENRARDRLADAFEVVPARTVGRALVLLREGTFAGVYVDSEHLSAVRLAGAQVQADEILDAIADGVAVVDPDLVVVWSNPEFARLTDGEADPVGLKFFRCLGSPEPIGIEACPFVESLASRKTCARSYRTGESRYHRLTVTPIFDAEGVISHYIVLTRDITDETLQAQKIGAIHRAADELDEVTPEELAEMSAEDRIDLLKYNIQRHMENLFGLDFIEIRRLDPTTGELVPLLTVRMTPDAAGRVLYARAEGNGVTGHVAATGQSYLCDDATDDPLYLEGAAGARSSLTVPIVDHGAVLGTLNVENVQPHAFDGRDLQYLEIYARSVAGALKMYDLLQAEKAIASTASVDAISRELALPIDDIIGDATSVLDRYAGHDDEIIARLRHLLFRAREIRKLVHKVGSAITPEATRRGPRSRRPLLDVEVLVVDAEQTVRVVAHEILDQLGATVETARDANEAIALARQKRYAVALVDIRLPDLNGHETFDRLLEAQPDLPIVLMTGYGYDPTHSIPKAKMTGKLAAAFYKKWSIEDVLKVVESAIEFGRRPAEGEASTDPSSPPPSPNPPPAEITGC